ncbi:efflux RND transporter periplasmic adaptor subunit [Paramixta manurensis]|uniref:Efflux RND transporter periplasmic adaptor subunit n=1 Tax=Paramixta manurensis TaxID=2740817 RepID=A0A6M8UL84_9GAMM|nr:efflux RND transporter periplasmic adaptor subunit [Erwiniaceae bacterium PD-1]
MMKKIILGFTALIIFAAGIGAGRWFGQSPAMPAMLADEQPATTARTVLYWYDPMAPGTRFDKPGKSPFMDMDLVPRYADEVTAAGGVAISQRQQQNLGVRTALATLRKPEGQLEGWGTLEVDERSIETLSAPANGRLEKLWVNASEQLVKAGQPLADLWIPEWTAAQQEYLAIRQLGDVALSAAARQRLQLQFMPETLIRSLERSGRPQTRITLRAEHDGYLNKLEVREGARFNAAQPLLTLASLNPLWMVMDYPQSQASALQVGSHIRATSASWPGEIFSGSVSELLPTVDPTTRTLKARVVLDNPAGKLRPGMYLTLSQTSTAHAQPVLSIPQEALIVSGRDNRVLVAEGSGYFRPVKVVTGAAQQGWVAIKAGLAPGDRVVTSGQFLIDSEASLRSALPSFTEDEADVEAGAPVSPEEPAPAAMEHAHGGHQ